MRVPVGTGCCRLNVVERLALLCRPRGPTPYVRANGLPGTRTNQSTINSLSFGAKLSMPLGFRPCKQSAGIAGRLHDLSRDPAGRGSGLSTQLSHDLMAE